MKNIFLIHGTNSFKKKEVLNNLIKKFSEADLEKYHGSKIDISSFLTNLKAIPFLSEKRLIILENFFSINERKKEEDEEELLNETSPIDKLLKALESLEDFIILVFFEEKALDKRLKNTKKIQKLSEEIECKSLDEKTSIIWLKDLLKQEKLEVLPGFEREFLKYSNSFDENKIKNDLKKISTFANGKKLSLDMIKFLIPKPLEIGIFNFTDAISNKNATKAIKFINELVENGQDIFYIFNMIVRQFRILIEVKDLAEKGESINDIAKKLKIHPYGIKLAVPQTKNFTKENLKDIFEKLLSIEIATKSNEIKSSTTDYSELTLAIEKLILNFCSKN